MTTSCIRMTLSCISGLVHARSTPRSGPPRATAEIQRRACADTTWEGADAGVAPPIFEWSGRAHRPTSDPCCASNAHTHIDAQRKGIHMKRTIIAAAVVAAFTGVAQAATTELIIYRQ